MPRGDVYYRDHNTKTAIESKGVMHTLALRTEKEDAQSFAAASRARGYNARVYARSIKADGYEIYVYVIVVRKKKEASQ